MTKKTDDTMPTTFPKKWMKILQDNPEFKENADSASTEDLKKIIITAEGNISLIEKEKENDEKLNGAKELVKEFSATYKEGLKAQMMKVKYAIFLLEGRGEDVGDRE